MRSSVIVLFSSLFMMSFGCEKNGTDDCNPTPKADCACFEIYQPVCGCDGVTYGNSCHAGCAGVAVVSEGVCPKDARQIPGEYNFLGYKKSDGIDLDNPKAKHSFPAYISFLEEEDQKKIDGRSGINFFNGSFSIGGPGKIDLSIYGTTKIAGSYEATAFEQNFWNNVNKATAFNIKDDLLLLEFDDDGKTESMVFQRK
ncbi:MAG: META domain-containing protein [Saprospiraceae bacterium]|nr:META domain-containing protein [Saprospiraceae bacterium]